MSAVKTTLTTSWKRLALVVTGLLLLAACDPPNGDGDCMTDAEEDDLGTDPNSLDSDGDGLDDCQEIELGTDPTVDDSDEDGFTDGEEIECVSDPLDGDEVCYSCGWAHNDPGTLESDGNEVGDTVANFVLADQCGDLVDVWDLSGKYYILYVTAAW